jgi:hypothetical protein
MRHSFAGPKQGAACGKMGQQGLENGKVRV